MMDWNQYGGLIYKFKFMGNNQYRERQLSQYLPNMQNFAPTHCYSPLSIYRNIYNSEEMMEFKETLYNTQDIDRKVQTFIARYQHLYLVSSLYMKLQGGNNCGNGEYQLSIFYERVVTNLSKIKEISFKDSLHCLTVALKGFEILYKNYGYFQIFQNMFHITQRGKLKVWCNQNIYKNVPEQYLLGEGRQEEMVLKIINIIDMNTDEACKQFPITDTLASLKKVNFMNAIVALRQICRDNGFTISESLDSLEKISHFQTELDIYAPPKRFPKDTQVTFHPKSSQNSQFVHQMDLKLTPLRSSSNSSHRTNKKNLPSERGRSMEASRSNQSLPRRATGIGQEDHFPNFVVGRPKNMSKSNNDSLIRLDNSSHSKTQAHPTQTKEVHSHLKQFSKMKPEQTQLKKRGPHIEVEQPVSRYSYVPGQRFINGNQAQNQQHPYMQIQDRPIQYQNIANMPVNQHLNPQLIQRSTAPQSLQRQASAPHIVFTRPQPQHQRQPQLQLQSQFMQSQVTPFRYQAPVIANSQASLNVSQLNRSIQPTVNRSADQSIHNRFPLPNNQYILNQNSQHQNTFLPAQVRQNNFMSNNHQMLQQFHPANQRRLQKNRGLSVPVTVTYQGSSSKELITAPKKTQERLSQYQNTNKNVRNNQNQRLYTLGNISSQKNTQLNIKPQKKDQKFNLTQLQSKIEMLESFADNKITTQQFLPNQSHALSGIKWEKNSNSGRDSITSAFRKDILLELSSKPSDKKGYEERGNQTLLYKKDSYSKPTSKFEENDYFTNQRLLQMIKNNNPKSYKYSQLTFQQKMKKYDSKYGRQDTIKELTTNESQSIDFYNQLYKRYNHKPAINNLFGDQIKTPTFGTHGNSSFKKKPQPYINKISAISEKWEEENVCSTSNGSRGRIIQSSNIDDDILEDMHNEGLGMHFKRGR